MAPKEPDKDGASGNGGMAAVACRGLEKAIEASV
jgi:hypothetical protein